MLRFFAKSDSILRKLINGYATKLRAVSIQNRLKQLPANINQQSESTSTTTEPPTQNNTPTEIVNQIESEISFALALDLNRSPRLSRKGDEQIEVHDKKQADTIERTILILTAK